MTDERRSNLIDVSYEQLHLVLSGVQEGSPVDQIRDHLDSRRSVLENVCTPSIFGAPSQASRQKIVSGTVELPDGIKVNVVEADKEFILAVSSKFNIDEIQAFILFRSFLYNQGLPPNLTAETSSQMVEALLEKITPYYYSERLNALRILGPLFKAYGDESDLLYDVACDFLPVVIPDPIKFGIDLLNAYTAKTKEKLSTNDPQEAIAHAKRSLHDQLAMLELFFQLMWGYAPCTGEIVVKTLETAYDTSFGAIQQHNTLILDNESQQLLQDCAALWIVITIEVLELETVGHDEGLEITETPSGKTLYIASPESLEKIHNIVISNTQSQFACTYLAWTYVLSRICTKTSTLDTIPPSYKKFMDIINPPANSRAFNAEPVYLQMTRVCLSPEAGLLPLINDLLTKSPLFVTSIAWRTGSALNAPNSLSYRSTLKGLVIALFDLILVENIPDFDGLVEVWIALFGRSEPSYVAPICLQWWQFDWPFSLPKGSVSASPSGKHDSAGYWSRRALVDVSRNRFPVFVTPLLRILRAMSGAGFVDTDPLAVAIGDPQQPSGAAGDTLSEERLACARFVYYYFSQLPTFAQVIDLSQCTGPHALYEKQSNPSNSSGMTYTNLRPLLLPGGSILPAKSTGNVISGDSGEYIVVAWDHVHSGWKLILAILGWYVSRRHMNFRTPSSSSTGLGSNPFSASDIAGAEVFSRHSQRGHPHFSQPLQIKIEDVITDMHDGTDEKVVTEALDLLRSVIQFNPSQAEELMASLDQPNPGSAPSAATPPPDLVQLTTMILEEALSRSGSKAAAANNVRMQLITSSLSVLAALLANPVYSNRVWLYIRSTGAIFGAGPGSRSVSDKSYASVALAMERATGQYTMTLALLHLVQQLVFDAALTVQSDEPGSTAKAKLQQVKEEVLLRAIRFVHNEIWIEHLGWRYNQLGDRFEIARRIATLYSCILSNFPPTLLDGHDNKSAQNDKDGKTPTAKPYPLLSQAIADVLLLKATTSTITPLVSSISSAKQVYKMLHASRRFGDVTRLLLLLDTLLLLSRQVLNCKLRFLAELGDGARHAQAPTISLLEQALCARVVSSGASHDHTHTKQDPIDVLAGYVKDREIGPDVPYQAIRLLTTLAKSLSISASLGSLHHSSLSNSALALTPSLAMSAAPTPTTMIGHLANPEAVVSAFVGIIQHPYDDPDLRIAVWKFIALVVDVEPALGGLFVAGKFRIPSDIRVGNKVDKGKEKEGAKDAEKEKTVTLAAKRKERNALTAAHDSLFHWRQLWDVNPQLLAAVLQFMTVVWEHAGEHKATIDSLRQDPKFWPLIVGIVKEEVGPVPDYETEEYVVIDKVQHSNHNEPVIVHAYRTLSKAYAVKLLSLDIGFHLQAEGTKTGTPPKKPQSFVALEPEFKSEDDLNDLLSEAAPSPYAPRLHDAATEKIEKDFPGLSLPQLEVQDPLTDRFYGDRFAFSVTLLQDRLHAFKTSIEADGMDDPIDSVTKLVLSINLNLSLTHAQTTLAESWEKLLRQAIPYLRPDTQVRASMINIAASISGGIALEKRGGEMMASIHGTRLALLLGILEVAWFSPSSSTNAGEIKSFIELIKNLKSIVNNDAQDPVKSFMSGLPNPFHRTLLQLLFFCAMEARSLLNRPKALNSDQRLTILETTEAVLGMVLEGLRLTFIAAQTRRDLDLDRDMELLVTVFRQCTRTDISPSSTFWLTRCQETDVMRASLELFVRTDLAGLSDVPVLLALKHPLYTPHILLFHMAVVSNPIAAERFASEGLLAAYSNNNITSAIRAGRVDVAIPELPGERSPMHLTYCSMLAIVATVITALGRHNHYFDAEACGFVQLYGDQILRALSWTVGDAITMPLMEELEQVVNLFYAIAASAPNAVKANPAVDKVLRVFTTHALLLLQQINYAITHPNHLASLFEPVTPDERAQHEKSQGVADPLKRPLIAHLVHRMFRLSSNIVGTLVTISKADNVLCGLEEDWPLGEALVVPHSKVVVGEPASLGTLLELGNCSLDILRDFVNRPAGQALTPTTPTGSSNPLDVRRGVITARRNLESVLVYAVTQLAMWLRKPEFEPVQAQDTDVEDQAMDVTVRPDVSKDRRLISTSAPRSSTSISMAERMRRGMTGEMASDLQALLNKAKPVVEKCGAVVGKESVDILNILSVFLSERIGGSS
ncbi:hypothetical protein CC1G_10650 [Coprinopsis cinerea okayama7|uniref:Nucleoporin Nup188 N-terminal subdomain III domain-containing protein n=1 Tax=Coprinopsis cinerea (strain Okayama-7 / 130 / ATCC MYA-4618 / FGSC 9003) TaxID=240176 RepID=A8P653_COPC7|nr:hypothetical protein CC1G_10650 [Coprinopsis cinerea okayama7\|eukprot:XP_001839085.2 hypothetical protein CC1G_10650 [Coprinopsis cinerea okayama7\